MSRPLGIDQQLSIPLFISGTRNRAFVVAREAQAFTVAEARLGRAIQPLLVGLERQSHVLSLYANRTRALPDAAEIAADLCLTGRELTVLELLSEGLTAIAIARRLGITARTVGKHQEHLYTKLHTRDRLAAVLRAQRLGLLPAGNCHLAPTESGSR